ncbi:hypothetical protein NDI76_05500 [Halogeometricum sp. S1BR25-6]|uniref:Uncharacterized protein n=1 Tax=Halogeometricum salsisoli TaxID=2950536 RepID=A0ABU2GD08_9EURY|nr:hypothetical protein [Halogeometricum sp. S1BR25-6]MDS0298189.1 hypothetical protein [Halogeometricum sp. S1BR25-6]
MLHISRALFAVLLVAVLAAATAAPAAAQTGSAADPTVGDESGELRCFPPGGHDLDIGTEGPGIAVTVHTSLFTNLGDEGALGMEARGSALNATIIELRTGVVFDGVGTLGDFLSDPFSRFAILFDYTFELPMFVGMVDSPGYESDESPVTGVESRGCGE